MKNVFLLLIILLWSTVYIALFVTFIVNTSLGTTSAFKMDVLTPGYMVANPNVRDIYLVDNTGKQPENYGHQVLRTVKNT